MVTSATMWIPGNSASLWPFLGWWKTWPFHWLVVNVTSEEAYRVWVWNLKAKHDWDLRCGVPKTPERPSRSGFGADWMSIGSWSLIGSYVFKSTSLQICLRDSPKLASGIPPNNSLLEPFFGEDEIGTVPPLERYLHALAMYVPKYPWYYCATRIARCYVSFAWQKHIYTRLLNILANFCCLQTSGNLCRYTSYEFTWIIFQCIPIFRVSMSLS